MQPRVWAARQSVTRKTRFCGRDKETWNGRTGMEREDVYMHVDRQVLFWHILSRWRPEVGKFFKPFHNFTYLNLPICTHFLLFYLFLAAADLEGRDLKDRTTALQNHFPELLLAPNRQQLWGEHKTTNTPHRFCKLNHCKLARNSCTRDDDARARGTEIKREGQLQEMHPDTPTNMPGMSKSEGREPVGAGGGTGEPCSHYHPGQNHKLVRMDIGLTNPLLPW